MFKTKENGGKLQVLSSARDKRISEKHRFALLYLGLMGMLCGSFGSYTFNLVSGEFQRKYGLNQRDLTTITTAGTVVGYVMLPYSFVYDYVGPLPITILSCFIFPLGALLTALCFQGVIVGTTVKLCVFYSFMNVGTSFFDLASCVTLLGHFPVNRGAVIALLKTFIGIGSAIIGSMFQGFFSKRMSPFFYFLMIVAFTVGVLNCIFMRHPSYQLTGYEESHLTEEEKARRADEKVPYLKQKPPMWRFYFGFGVIIFLIIFLPVTSALVNYLALNDTYRLAFAIIATIGLVSFVVIAIPFPQGSAAEAKRRASEAEEGAEAEAAAAAEEPAADLLDEATLEIEEVKQGNSKDEQPVVAEMFFAPEDADEPKRALDTEIDYIAPQYQTTFLRNLLTVQLWALWWTTFCVYGTEVVIMNNASYIFASLAGEETPRDTRNLLTVLNGVGSGVGRLLMSLFEHLTQQRPPEKRIPLTIALFIPTTSVIVTLVLLLSLPKVALPLPYVIAAIGNGFLGATVILVTRTIYAKDNAKHYHFCFFAIAVSSVALNRFLYGEWYTVKNVGNEKYCTHRVCVQTPLLVLLGLCVTAFGSNVVVHFTYRNYTIKMLAERRRILNGNTSLEETDETPRVSDENDAEHVSVSDVNVAGTSRRDNENSDPE